MDSVRMDLSAPVEMTRFELVRFGDGRSQAYLTLLGESEDPVVSLEGDLIFRLPGGSGESVCRVSFDTLSIERGAETTGHVALDSVQASEDAAFVPRRAMLASGTVWEEDPERLVDCGVTPEAAGVGKTALLAAAGADAVCYPERTGSTWRCACGRMNRLRWTACRRCGRDRETVLGITRGSAMQALDKAVSRDEAAGEPEIPPLHGRTQPEAQGSAQEERRKPAGAKKEPKGSVVGRIVTVLFWLLALVAFAAAARAVLDLVRRLNDALHSGGNDFLGVAVRQFFNA